MRIRPTVRRSTPTRAPSQFDANGRLILTSDGTVYARTNPQNDSGAWSRISGNVSAFEVYTVAYDAVGKRLAVAAQDNGVSIQSAAARCRRAIRWVR